MSAWRGGAGQTGWRCRTEVSEILSVFSALLFGSTGMENTVPAWKLVTYDLLWIENNRFFLSIHSTIIYWVPLICKPLL